MRALLIATGFRENMGHLLERQLTALLRIADKPILLHIFDTLHHLGLGDCDLVISHDVALKFEDPTLLGKLSGR